MFPLHLRDLPRDTPALAQALTRSLSKFLSTRGDAVTIEGAAYPALDSIRVDLDGATVLGQAPGSLHAIGATEPAFTVAEITISGRGVRVEGATIDFDLRARDVALHQGRDAQGDIVLILHQARDGQVEISAAHRDLEDVIARLAKAEAAKQGVNVESARLQIHSHTNRSLDLQIELRAKKLFLAAVVRIRGRLEVDDTLVATASGLVCEGDGALGAIAAGVLTPHLQRLAGRRLELMALPLGEIRLRGVRIEAGERIAVHAEFGSAA